MGSSALVDASQAWVKHMRACPTCLAVANAFGAGERCTEGEALRNDMLSLRESLNREWGE